MAEIGEAPYENCNRFSQMCLTGETKPAGDGGKFFRVVAGQRCPDCGLMWEWLHQPPANDLVLGLTMTIAQPIDCLLINEQERKEFPDDKT